MLYRDLTEAGDSSYQGAMCGQELSSCRRTLVEPRILRRLVAVAVLAACLGGCTVSVSASSDNLIKEQKYDALWLADWRRIATGQHPFQASASSPGVCNSGGSKQGCYDTDLKVIADYRKLESDLSGSVVPSEFARANTTLHRAIAELIQGLSDRDQAIASQNPNATFTESNKELALGQQTCKQAETQYHGIQLPVRVIP
jgi:hypothetical protein